MGLAARFFLHPSDPRCCSALLAGIPYPDLPVAKAALLHRGSVLYRSAILLTHLSSSGSSLSPLSLSLLPLLTWLGVLPTLNSVFPLIISPFFIYNKLSPPSDLEAVMFFAFHSFF